MPPQTILLLTILLERAGSIVSRDDLKQLLWPDGEFIDHEHAINRAINHLRMVLRDNPKKPHFIETLPKRGYRFVADVTSTPVVTTPVWQASPELVPLESSPAMITAELVYAAPVSSRTELAASASAFLLPGVIRSSGRRWALAACLVVLAASIVAVVMTRRVPDPAPITSMGIVPFEVHGAQAEQLEESFRMDLTDALSQLPTVQLRASHSLPNTMQDDASLREISKTLHLDLLLLGKFTVQNDQCLLQLELVRGRDAVHLASFDYKGSINELATIRERVQKDIFTSLQLGGKSIQARGGSTQNPQAYSSYLQARDLASRRTLASLSSALIEYQSATGRDPTFARAYAGMATVYLGLASHTDSPGNLEAAQIAAQRALQLDPKLAEAHGVLGFVAVRKDWNATVGLNELSQAVELEPNQAAYHAWLAEFLADEGRFDEALHQIDLALTNDPLWPQIYVMDVFVAEAARQHERSIQAARKFLELRPASPFGQDQLAWSLFDAAHYEEAIAQWRSMASTEKDSSRVALEDRGLAAFQRGGAAAYGSVRLAAIKDHLDAVSSHPNDFVPEEWYAYVGDRDAAMALLTETVTHHDPGAIDLAVNPMLDNLHHDPRFVALLSRVGLVLPVAQSSLHALARN